MRADYGTFTGIEWPGSVCLITYGARLRRFSPTDSARVVTRIGAGRLTGDRGAWWRRILRGCRGRAPTGTTAWDRLAPAYGLAEPDHLPSSGDACFRGCGLTRPPRSSTWRVARARWLR